MATQLFLYGTNGTDEELATTSWGEATAPLTGAARGWDVRHLYTTRASGSISINQNTVAGPTDGLEVGTPFFITPPLDADTTISGTVTFNIWCFESAMTANVAPRVLVERLGPFNNLISTIIDSTTTEMGTSAAAKNWTGSPTSTDMLKGDRIRIRLVGDDAGTMASGASFQFFFGAASAGVQGDTYVTFTETFGFLTTAASGSIVYPTNTTSAVATAAVDREAWTSRGAGAQNDPTSTVAGWTDPLQTTDTAGGTVVDWWTRPLAGMTLGGRVDVNLRCHQSTTNEDHIVPRVEIAVCENDGSSCVNWAMGTPDVGNSATSETAKAFFAAGPDTTITSGQRLRIRFLIDDGSSKWTAGEHSVGPMTASRTFTMYYAGTTGGASGDTWLQFSQTLTEGSAAAGQTARRPTMTQALSH